MPTYSLTDLLAAVGGQTINVSTPTISFDRIVTDSRIVRPDDVFWAIAGDIHDGHTYITEAARRGAVACVVEPDRVTQPVVPVVCVNNTRQALTNFAAWHRNQIDTLVIGVTGSVGKTTTRHLLHTVLTQRFAGVESPRNFNNEIGVPLSLLEITPDHEFAALEFGASHEGEIRRHCETARPEIGLLTRIAPSHLDEFGDIDTISRTKGELLEALPTSGFAVLNGDDERVRHLASRADCPTILVGERPHNDFVANRVTTTNTHIAFRVDGCDFQLPAMGRHHLTSALLSVAVAREFGLSTNEIISGFEQFQPVDGRCRMLRIGDLTVIDDTYNSSPASMEAACDLLSQWQGRGRRVLVMGDMLALGSESRAYHEQLGRRISASGIDRLITWGTEAQHVADRAHAAGMDAGCIGTCADPTTLSLLLEMWLEPGDVVLVKGSRGMQMERVIEQLKRLSEEQPVDTTRPFRAVA
ncbi:MAG: UDP-N-acetylmuramoyl-tripeptide--D-alanyl-D-alanine ligase [Planctomycetaceae bacterium]